MSVVKHFIEDSIKKTEIDEFLQNEFERAGYGGVSITKTPLGTHLVIYTMRPGLVIGRGGETIRALAQVLEEKFQLPSPQISVAEIEIPELNAYVVASRVASALKRGVHYRRAGFWGLTQTMEAGALGAEIIISGKLRTDRARYEKFKTGYLPKSGDPPRKYMRKAELHVQTKPGILGVKVRLIPPDAQFPDQVKVQIVEEELEPETAIMEEPIVTKETTSKPEVLPPEETVPVEETPIPSVEEKAVTEEKTAAPEVPKVEKKSVTEKPVAKAEAAPVKEEKVSKPEAPSKAEKPVAEKKVEPKVVVKKPKREWTGNPMLMPIIEKVTVNMSVGKSGAPLEQAVKILTQLTGQKPSKRQAKKTVREFGIRKGESIACLVTLRGEKADAFLKKAFVAVDKKISKYCFDRQGNFSFGIKEHIDIPGTKYVPELGIHGMDVAVSLGRAGYRVKRRHRVRCDIGKDHLLTSKEAILFIKDEFDVQIA